MSVAIYILPFRPSVRPSVRSFVVWLVRLLVRMFVRQFYIKSFVLGDGAHKPLAFDQILVHLFLLFVFNLINKILFKPKFCVKPVLIAYFAVTISRYFSYSLHNISFVVSSSARPFANLCKVLL